MGRVAPVKWIVRAILFVCLLAGIVWFSIDLVIQNLQPSSSTVVASKTGLSKEEVDSALSKSLLEVGISWDATHPSPELTLADAQIVRQKALSYSVESYLIPLRKELHFRVYDRNSLLYDWIIDKNGVTTEITSVDLTDSDTNYTVAIVLEGLESQLIEPFLKSKLVLNYALSPTSPFALRNAVQAAIHWNEVILDARQLDAFQINALPFATAIWANEPLPVPYGTLLLEHNTVKQLDLAETTPFSESNKLYSLDMAQYTTEQVLTWLKSLPPNIKLVRLSHWDVHRL